ncbi:hypothetical protein [Campylobacter vicugnae]|uniref:hypothetical protein n=1 Tax=Campylobacter vicugnae TaxID=1660076 RepID=UPI00254CCDDC|nr:hypothetical protein [Campylobacter ovis]MDL0104523.1 hypothetical protein [Campylobacter ovis]MDL0106298.1 hypothetical protein [Campylobacter ovis]
MARYGQTANGMAHFAPMMRLEAPQLDIGNPFKDYIAQAIAERELELKEKGLGLDEQKLAYVAANDEENRQHAIDLAKLKTKGEKDNLTYKYSWMEKIGNQEREYEKQNKIKFNEIADLAQQKIAAAKSLGYKGSPRDVLFETEFLKSLVDKYGYYDVMNVYNTVIAANAPTMFGEPNNTSVKYDSKEGTVGYSPIGYAYKGK